MYDRKYRTLMENQSTKVFVVLMILILFIESKYRTLRENLSTKVRRQSIHSSICLTLSIGL
jgi:hypothetical protein